MSRAERRHARDMRCADVGAKGGGRRRRFAHYGNSCRRRMERPRDIFEPGPPTSVLRPHEVLDIL